MSIKNWSKKNKSEKLIRISQIAVNLSVVLALSPVVGAVLTETANKVSDWPQRIRRAAWDFLSRED